MTNTAAITPIKRKPSIIVTDQIKGFKEEKRYINRTTKYIIVK